MVLVDGLPHRPRSAVNHKPELPLLVRLELDEVVTAAQRSKLYPAVPQLEFLKRRTQRSTAKDVGQPLLGSEPRMTNGGNRSVETCQQTRCRRFVRKDGGVTLETKSGHAAADVVSHRVGIDESLRRDYCAGADLVAQVHVGHHCHVT